MFVFQLFRLLLKPRILVASFGGLITIVIIAIHTNYINDKHIKKIGLKKEYEERILDYRIKMKNLLSIMEDSVFIFVSDVFKDDTANQIKGKIDLLKDNEKDNKVLKKMVDEFNTN